MAARTEFASTSRQVTTEDDLAQLITLAEGTLAETLPDDHPASQADHAQALERADKASQEPQKAAARREQGETALPGLRVAPAGVTSASGRLNSDGAPKGSAAGTRQKRL